MTIDEFIGKWNGRGIDFDNYYGDQCMDLMHQYHVEVLGITDGRTLAAPAAKDVYLNFPNVFNSHLFEQIKNTPTGVPQKGDIIFWGTGLGTFGHVAIFIEGDANKFKSFDQNFPTGSKCKVVEHTYTGVLGWLRPKATVATVQVDGETFQRMREKCDRYDEFTAAGYPTVGDVVKQIASFNSDKNSLTSDLRASENRVETLAGELEKLSKENGAAIEEGYKAQKERDAMLKDYEKLQQRLIDVEAEIDDKDVEIEKLKEKLKLKEKELADQLGFIGAVRLVVQTLTRWGKEAK